MIYPKVERENLTVWINDENPLKTAARIAVRRGRGVQSCRP